MRRLVAPLLGIALTAVLVIGLTHAGGKSDNSTAPPKFDLQQAQYKQPSAILEGGPAAFDKRLATLKGHPAVVNKWASWCRPCRAEFPIFQQVATARGEQVAFLGENGADKLPAAKKFLDERA